MTSGANDGKRCFSILLKVCSSACNLGCEYCYYTRKEVQEKASFMSEELLEHCIREIFEVHGREAIVEFNWHGGEPLLRGINFFRKAVELQRKFGARRPIRNTLQTNGTLLNEEWCSFFHENRFLIGISIDGPRRLHDAFRKYLSGGGSFDDTMRGLGLLTEHRVEFNTLTAVHSVNIEYPLEVYRFLRMHTDHLQFLPVVEKGDGSIAAPPGIVTPVSEKPLLPFSLRNGEFGNFLCSIYGEWKSKDAGRKSVQFFEVIRNVMAGNSCTLCSHDAICGHCASIEANGAVYACDRYTHPHYRIGNISQEPLAKILERNRSFGMFKTLSLPEYCLKCEFIKLCFGGCPKDRFQLIKHNGHYAVINHFCEDYRKLFLKIKQEGYQEMGH